MFRPFLKAINFKLLSESEVTKKFIVENGVDSNYVTALIQATSTKEESAVILNYCKQHQLKKAIVVTSKFHLRRVGMVFKELFEENGIEVILRGAPSSAYNEEEWWNYELGLIMVNNEYVKLLYYLIKY